jgi:hypothetical protein
VFEDFHNLQVAGIGNAIIEQQNAYNEASPLTLENCGDVRVADLRFFGTGTPRPDGAVPQQTGMRVVRSRYVWVERCEFGPLAGEGTIMHGIHISDDSHWVWLRGNHFHRITASGVIVGSGIWPHPSDPSAFDGHWCTNIHIVDNDFDTIGTAVNIDDHTVLSWILGNRVRLHYAAAITIEDGSIWFVVSGNQCGPGHAAAVSLRGGQTGVFASRGIVANNTAAGCNRGDLAVPPGFYSETPRNSAFERRSATHVLMPATSNLDLRGG